MFGGKFHPAVSVCFGLAGGEAHFLTAAVDWKDFANQREEIPRWNPDEPNQSILY